MGAGIDVNPIRSNIWFAHRRVSVDDDFAKITFMKQKILPDPKQVFDALVRQRNTGSDTGMHEEKVTAGEGGLQIVEEAPVA